MQEIITYSLITAALAYTLYGIVKLFIPSKDKGHCCSSGCSSCSVGKHVESL